MSERPYYLCEVPQGSSGPWLLERFQVEGDRASTPTSAETPSCGHRRPGTYSRLKRGDTVFMTDLYDEWFTQKIAIDQALRRGGHALIGGLGLGLILDSIFRATASPVERITVLEQSTDVIALIAPHFRARYPDRLEIVQADVFTWTPPAGFRYSVIWHDIWPNPQADETVADMALLEARYGPFGDWVACWPREYRWIYEGLAWDREGAATRQP